MASRSAPAAREGWTRRLRSIANPRVRAKPIGLLRNAESESRVPNPEHADINPDTRVSGISPGIASCAVSSTQYWQESGARRLPDAFVKALTDAGWLAALIPEQYGGGGLNITEASVILEEINRSGANSGACHAQMYIMRTLLRHGSEAQKNHYLPGIASGQLRLQSFAVTEPTTGTDTTKTRTFATRKGDRYIVNGQKVC